LIDLSIEESSMMLRIVFGHLVVLGDDGVSLLVVNEECCGSMYAPGSVLTIPHWVEDVPPPVEGVPPFMKSMVQVNQAIPYDELLAAYHDQASNFVSSSTGDIVRSYVRNFGNVRLERSVRMRTNYSQFREAVALIAPVVAQAMPEWCT
jgi:hypothetical protein